jgi:hypothetical protein
MKSAPLRGARVPLSTVVDGATVQPTTRSVPLPIDVRALAGDARRGTDRRKFYDLTPRQTM